MKHAAIIFASLALVACGADGVDEEVDVDLSPQDAQYGVDYLEDGTCVAPFSFHFELSPHGDHWLIPPSEVFDGCNGVKYNFALAAVQQGQDRRWGIFHGFVDVQDDDAFFPVHGRFMHVSDRVPFHGTMFGGFHDGNVSVEIDGDLFYSEYYAPETFRGYIHTRGL